MHFLQIVLHSNIYIYRSLKPHCHQSGKILQIKRSRKLLAVISFDNCHWFFCPHAGYSRSSRCILLTSSRLLRLSVFSIFVNPASQMPCVKFFKLSTYVKLVFRTKELNLLVKVAVTAKQLFVHNSRTSTLLLTMSKSLKGQNIEQITFYVQKVKQQLFFLRKHRTLH